MPEGLYRTESDRVVAGVCGGIAEYAGVEPRTVRAVFVVMFFASWFWYLAGVLAVPTESELEGMARE